ncbi:MAG: hypothetical protein A2286_13405 [Gammaproteobacteria bacterium RIFOXYA12_FULL_61_12]|nr:MAG: hypothetical protein A2286_13405 [Gammaproteobacteria bacterium RIFOXYA12_FULL_61_12]
MDQNQYYPTPEALARRAWAKFQNKKFGRILEPSAGKGDLAKLRPHHTGTNWHTNSPPVDCIEVNLEHHANLRKEGFSVVGIDFLKYEGAGAIYSHVVMNPPFAQGAQHVLKAWDLLYDGEIVAILNAETVRNPFSKERAMLGNLIQKYGSVEYIEGAFSDAERETDVEVALVHLCKKARFGEELTGSIMDGLQEDMTTRATLAGDFAEMNSLALPGEFIKNAVLAFSAAVKAARESVTAQARENHYAGLLGHTLEQRNGSGGETLPSSLDWVREELHKRYETLKDRAWAGILRSTQVADRLSSSAQRRLESDFQTIKSLEFTTANVYGFLQGLSANQSDIQIGMLCDVFDLITRYYTDNTVYYKGWKSNDKHRTCGIRVKTSRFVIPGYKSDSWSSSLNWNGMQMLADFDKAFALLDGKVEPTISLASLFYSEFDALKGGARLSSSYFDVRYYPGAGTLHFFARNKDLIARLNLLVGRHRQWLPPQGARVSDAFWLQYEKAEKFDRELRDKISSSCRQGWDNPMAKLACARYDTSIDKEVAERKMNEALDAVLAKHDIDPNALLEAPQEAFKLLACA